MRTTTAAAAGLFVIGCTASAEEVRPPNGADPTGDSPLFFPTGAAVSPAGTVLFVANANSELRYDSGSIAVFPIAPIRAAIDAWVDPARKEVPSGCSPDGDHVETLNCEAFNFIDPQAGARVGNFATDIAVQQIGPDDQLRLIVPTRGDPSIAWVDWANDRLSCTTGEEPFALCDDTHRLSFVLNDADLLSIPEEPFGAYADSAGEFAIVTHLTTGAVTLIDSPRGGNAQITDITASAFQPDSSTGLRGATGVTGHNGIVYVGSRSEDRIQMFTVGRPVNGMPPFLLMGNWFFLDAVGSNNGGSSDTRGMTFSPSGDRLYLVNRRPPSLQIVDTSLGPTGFPKNQPIGATDICRQASTLVVAGQGEDQRVYVSCFQDGQLYIVDPRGAAQTEDIITVGRGPYAVTVAPPVNLVFVTNFLEDTIAVIDIKPDSKTRNRVVLRIGTPRGRS